MAITPTPTTGGPTCQTCGGSREHPTDRFRGCPDCGPEATAAAWEREATNNRRVIVELTEARGKSEAFKTWVHAYLDSHGVPHHPPGCHGSHGCRIGDRMDWLMARLREAEGREVRWTSAPPTRDGWYWYRATPTANAVAVHVASKAPDFIRCAQFGSTWYSLTLMAEACQWSDRPVPEPGAPDADRS